MEVKIYTKGIKAHGVSIIVDNLISILNNNNIGAKRVHELSETLSNDLIIPYGVKESVEMINSGVPTKVSMLIDAISLGYYNKIRFYLKKCLIYKKDFWYSLYAFCRYSREEKKVCYNFEKIMLVSAVDAKYLAKQSKQPLEKFLIVRNGITQPVNVEQKKKSSFFQIGLLSSWFSFQVYEESNWFVRDYFRRYIKKNDNCKLCIAGRGPIIKQFNDLSNVIVQGEVEDLNDFFSNIDVFVAVNPKGCGVLNRVLDAFAYKTPVLAFKSSMSGFPDSSEICLTFSNYKSFANALNMLREDQNLRETLVEKACEYLKENADWERNYLQFVNTIKKYLDEAK